MSATRPTLPALVLAPGSARLKPAERAWAKTQVRRAARDIAYYTLADAKMWLAIVRKINVKLRTAPTTLLAHRVEMAGQYLAVKRYVETMSRIIS